MSPTPATGTDSGEEGRAFLQDRVGLFWKFVFGFMLIATVLGIKGPLHDPGPDLLLDVALTIVAAILWRLCRTGTRSVRFLRVVEAGGLAAVFLLSAMLGRYVLAGFVVERALVTGEGQLMADAYLGAVSLIGLTLLLVIRAAVVPSSPRRTLVYTALFSLPPILTATFVAVTPDGFVLRAADAPAWPWLPATLAMMWGFLVFTSTITTRVVHGLRREVREARQLGQYVIEHKIGEGGMGEVYRARHGLMRRPTALKLLRPDRASEASVARFEREVQQTARLTHPNTITIFDYGRTDDGTFYYAMELLDGANLHRIVSVTGPQPASRVIRILTMACGALTEAHGIGLIHRDVKPANIILCTQGGERDVVKLLDFGLVKELAVDGDVELTGKATLTGSPQYMAPEAIRAGGSVDARTDLYALGAVAYFLLAGGALFTGKSLVEVCSQHLHQAPAPLASRGVEVPAELEAIVRACLEKDPALRPPSAAALRQRLEACAIPRWDAAQAEAWWREHGAAVEDSAADRGGGPRTIAVDRALRSTVPV